MRITNFLLAALSLATVPQAVFATPATVTVCNYSPGYLYATFLIRWNCGGDMEEPKVCRQSNGWYRVERGICRPITFEMANFTNFGGHPAYNAQVFVRAEGEGGRYWNGSTTATCYNGQQSTYLIQEGKYGILTDQGSCVTSGRNWGVGFWPITNGRIEFN